jgi:PEP-CTERM motif
MQHRSIDRFAIRSLAATGVCWRLLMAAGLMFVSQEARADPVTIVAPSSASAFDFSVNVTLAFGPMEALFGRSFQVGDVVSGTVIFDPARASADLRPDDPRQGEYVLPDARISLNVPSGLVLQATDSNLIKGSAFDNLIDVGDELIFNALEHRCCGAEFVNMDVLWIDNAARALNSDALPTNPDVRSRFRVNQIGLLADIDVGQVERVALFGSMDLRAPVPEPSSLLLIGAGAVLCRRVRGHRRENCS